MVEIKQQLVPQAKRYATYGTGNPKKKLVVHQTGNRSRGANAKMHANLQARGWRNASWHIQSDDKEIIQSWPFTYRLWHASTGRASSGGNMEGIGWEICVNSDGDYVKSLELAAKGIAQVMKQEGIPMSGLTTHNAEDPNNKWCPAQILSGWHDITWSKFKQMVQKAYDGNKIVVQSKPKPTPKKTNEQVAREVLEGKWGNNPKRRNDLIAAGYNYNTIQSIVNRLANGSKPRPATKPPTSKKSAEQVAQDIAKGLGGWGNNPQRAQKLKAAGYNATTVQNRVNEILSGKKSAPKKIASKTAKVGDTVTAKALYGTAQSTKNVRSSNIKGYVADIDNSRRNPIRLRNKKGGYYIGFTRKQDIV